MNQSERRQYLIRSLFNEDSAYRGWRVPQGADEQRRLLRGLMNVRPARASYPEFLKIQDAYLRAATAEKGVTDIDDLSPVQPGIYLWQGDITTLRCAAIVNAANSGMTGCYVPNHRCIDNAIHTFAGVQLRSVCAEIMEAQGALKPVYENLYKLVQGRDYFVITTNVDHCFQKAGFDKRRLFYTQGDYGLFQCSRPCCHET